MPREPAPWLAAAAAFAALLIALVLLRDLPVLGALAGAVVAGAVAVLLAEEPRSAALAALLASAAALGLVLAARALLGLQNPFRPLVDAPFAVDLLQLALVAAIPGALAWGVGRGRGAKHAP